MKPIDRLKQQTEVEQVCDRCGLTFQYGEKKVMVGTAAMFSNLQDPGYRMVHDVCPETPCAE